MASRDVTIFIRAVDRATKVLNSISRGSSMALKGLAVGAAAASAAVIGLSVAYGGLIRSGIQYNAQMERFQATLETTMKSQERAIKTIVWAKKFAAETPFQIPEIIEATVRLETYGLKASKTLQKIGDMAAIMGKPLMQAIEAIADAQTGELERLKEFGITKRMLVEAGMGVTAAGQVKDFQQLNDTLFKIMEERYEGGMQKMMKGFTGVVSNLQDVWGQITGALAEPIFEAVKKEMFSLIDAIEKFKKTGKLDKLLANWGKAGENAFRAITAAIRQVMPVMVEWLQKTGQALAEFTANISPEAITKFTKKAVAFGTAIMKASVSVGKFIVENRRLVISLGALMLLTKLTVMVLNFSKAVWVVVGAIKVWTAANAALMAVLGPVGLGMIIVGLIAYLISYKLRMREAKDETQAFIREAARLKAEKFLEAAEDINKRVEDLQRIIKSYETPLKKLKGYIAELERGFEVGAFYDIEKYQKYLDNARKNLSLFTTSLTEYKNVLPKLVAEQTKFNEAQKKAAEEEAKLVAAEAKKKRVKEALRIAELITGLEKDYTKLISSEAENRRRTIEERYAETAKQAKGNAKALELIARNKAKELEMINMEEAAMFAKIQADKVKEAKYATDAIVAGQKQAFMTIMQLTGNEEALRRVALKNAYDETLAATKDIRAAETVVALMKKKYAKDDEIVAKRIASTKVQLGRDMNMAIFEAEGNTHAMRMIRIANEVDAMKEKGATEEQITRFLAAQLASMRKEVIDEIDEKEKKSAKERKARLEKVTTEILRIETNLRNSVMAGSDMAFQYKMTQLFAETEAYKKKGVDQGLVEAFLQQETIRLKAEEVQRFAELETQKTQIMIDSYQNYVSIGLQLSDILFRAQDVGWERTLASLIRFGTRLIAEYMRNLAMEKMKQAAEASTQAKWLRAHASRLAALVVESTVLATMAVASGNFAAAAAYGAAAIQAGAGAAAAMIESGVFEAQAAMLKTGATVLMIGAAAVETAGEVVARGIEHAARIADDATRKTEERKMTELKLQNDILEAQGRGHEVRIAQIQREAAEFKKMGADISLVEQWQRTMAEREASRAQAVTAPPPITVSTAGEPTAAPSPVAPIIIGGGELAAAGAQTIIYQTNHFHNLIDLSRQEELRTLAFLLAPFNEEIEELSKE